MKKLLGFLCSLAALAAALVGFAALFAEKAEPQYVTIYDDSRPGGAH